MFYFIGSLFPPNLEMEINRNSIGQLDNAANALQWHLVEGFIQNNSKMKILTLPGVGTYPKNYKKIFIGNTDFTASTNIKGYSLPFLTLPIIGLVSRYISLNKKLKRQLREISKDDIFIIYSLKSAFLLACYKLKKRIPGIHICVIVPDLPQYMSESNNLLYKLLKKFDQIIIFKCLKHFNSFVVLSEAMCDPLHIGNRKWIRMEGIAEPHFNNVSYPKASEFVFCYTGTLDIRYGIIDLLNAFTRMNGKNLRLWICGKGNAESYIKNCCVEDNRISYLGQLPHKEILSIQAKATILVNPRTPIGEYTKYSFPSKTMEYLASGTPCIMYKLPTLPEEYINHIFVVDSFVKDGLFKKMTEVYHMPQNLLQKKAQEALSFIKTKSPKNQVSRIIKMITTTSV